MSQASHRGASWLHAGVRHVGSQRGHLLLAACHKNAREASELAACRRTAQGHGGHAVEGGGSVRGRGSGHAQRGVHAARSAHLPGAGLCGARAGHHPGQPRPGAAACCPGCAQARTAARACACTHSAQPQAPETQQITRQGCCRHARLSGAALTACEPGAESGYMHGCALPSVGLCCCACWPPCSPAGPECCSGPGGHAAMGVHTAQCALAGRQQALNEHALAAVQSCSLSAADWLDAFTAGLQASLGGSPSRQAQLRAYLRVKLADKGPLDFDAPGGLDTSWRRIFLALRCGFHDEAIQARFLGGRAPSQQRPWLHQICLVGKSLSRLPGSLKLHTPGPAHRLPCQGAHSDPEDCTLQVPEWGTDGGDRGSMGFCRRRRSHWCRVCLAGEAASRACCASGYWRRHGARHIWSRV